MIQSFFIQGRLPNLNDMLAASRKSRGKWNAFNEMKQAHEDYIVLCIKQAKLKAVVQPIILRCVWQEANKRRDPSNIRAAVKFIEDALQKAGILSNDGWAQISKHEDYYTVAPKEHIGVRVEIETVY